MMCSALPAAVVIGCGACIAARGEPPVPAIQFSDAERIRILQHSPLPPAPADPTNRVADDPAAARLGQHLFFDPRLSGNGQVSCATCHDPARAFTDGRPIAVGLEEARRNTPSIWNAAHQRWLFWDGRADSLWAQALSPIEDDKEMRGSRLRVARLVHEDPLLRELYAAVFGPLPGLLQVPGLPDDAKPIPASPQDARHAAWMAISEADRDAVNQVWADVGKAIAAYERRLIAGRAPFDIFAEGLREGDATKLEALSPAAQRGLRLFIGRANCRLCHSGPNFSDGEFHNIGMPDRRGGIGRDSGRYAGLEHLAADPFNAAGPYSDHRSGEAAERTRATIRPPETWGQFKTPSLRNVTLTAPYMHQGQMTSLREVLSFYSTLEDAVQAGHHRESILVPLNLSEEETSDLIAFLESLADTTGPQELLRAPERPAAGEVHSAGDIEAGKAAPVDP
jgi:cytochrome c peroxidase